jgi:uncharacterized membrane protein YfcA
MVGKKKVLFPLNIFLLLIVWITVLIYNGDFTSVLNYWMYSVTMLFGAIVAGLTPLGGGMIAFPVLSLYFDVDPGTARDFSLAIQAMGMTSASIYILTRKKISINILKYFPFFIFINCLGFVIGTGLYEGFNKQLVAYMYTRKDTEYKKLDFNNKSIKNKMLTLGTLLCFTGGIVSAFFGTGTDLFLYVLLTMYLNLKEKISTDISIIAMATMSIFGFFYRYFFVGIDPGIVNMWLASVPIVIFFAPFGNKLLQYISKKYFLYLILILTAFNWLYFINRMPSYVFLSLGIIATFLAIFILLKKSKKPKISLDNR